MSRQARLKPDGSVRIDGRTYFLSAPPEIRTHAVRLSFETYAMPMYQPYDRYRTSNAPYAYFHNVISVWGPEGRIGHRYRYRLVQANCLVPRGL